MKIIFVLGKMDFFYSSSISRFELFCGGNFSFLLQDNNRLLLSGYNSHHGNDDYYIDYFQDVDTSFLRLDENIKTIACGSYFYLLLTTNNRLLGSGTNSSGQLGIDDEEYYDDGYKISDISNYQFQEIDTSFLEEGDIIKQIYCGENYSFLLTENNLLYACGDNYHNQLSLEYFRSKAKFTRIYFYDQIKQIICGRFHTLLLTENNKLYGCGLNSLGQLGIDILNEKITYFQEIDVDVDIETVVINGLSTYILTKDRQIYCCGSNHYGQLGLGDNIDRDIFTKVDTEERIISITSNSHFSYLVLTESNKLYSCGNNEKGQLGLGDNINRNRLTRISTLDILFQPVKTTITGSGSTFIIDDKRQIYGCGSNYSGELGAGEYIRRLNVFKKINII